MISSFFLHINYQCQEDSKILSLLTRCVSHVLGVSETNGDSNAEDHEDPVDLRDVYLAMNIVRRVHDFHSGKATQRLALVDDGEGSADDGLAADHRRQDRQH